MPQIKSRTDRINPELFEIHEQYIAKKKEGKKLQERERSLQTTSHCIENNGQKLQLNLLRKKQQLKYLKNVRKRYLSDLRHKLQESERRNSESQDLRLRSEQMRRQHDQNMGLALRQKKKKNHRITQQVRKQLHTARHTKLSENQKMKEMFEMRLREQRQQKQIGKSRISQFYNRKSKGVFNRYRSMIQDQEEKTNNSRQHVHLLESKTAAMRKEIEQNSETLHLIEDEIEKYKKTSVKLKHEAYRGTLQSLMSRESQNLDSPLGMPFRKSESKTSQRRYARPSKNRANQPRLEQVL